MLCAGPPNFVWHEFNALGFPGRVVTCIQRKKEERPVHGITLPATPRIRRSGRTPASPYPPLRLKHYYDTILFVFCQCTTSPSGVYSLTIEGVQLQRRHCSPRAFRLFNSNRSGCSTWPLYSRGLILKKGTIVDSTIISAPSSTKNKEKKRDQDAHSVKKGTAWHFGYKAHIGVDKDSGLVHHVEVTSANVHDVEMTPKLMTGDESELYGDSGYIGAEKRQDAIIRNKQGKKIRYKQNRKPTQIGKLSASGQWSAKKAEHQKSSVRAKVKHVFAVTKGQFRYRKTRYRGLSKRTAKLNMLFALANLVLADRHCQAARPCMSCANRDMGGSTLFANVLHPRFAFPELRRDALIITAILLTNKINIQCNHSHYIY